MTKQSFYDDAPASSEFRPGKVPRARPGPVGGVRDRNRAERAQALGAAGLRLFRLRGLEAVTVDDITREAGVAKGSFYRYFSDKAQLVSALFAPLDAALGAAFDACEAALAQADAPEALNRAYERLALDLASVCLRSPELVLLYLRECRSPARGTGRAVRELSDRVTERALALTHVAHRHGLLRELPPAVTALGVVGAVETLLFHHLEGRDLGDPERATRALVSLVLDGLRAR